MSDGGFISSWLFVTRVTLMSNNSIKGYGCSPVSVSVWWLVDFFNFKRTNWPERSSGLLSSGLYCFPSLSLPSGPQK